MFVQSIFIRPVDRSFVWWDLWSDLWSDRISHGYRRYAPVLVISMIRSMIILHRVCPGSSNIYDQIYDHIRLPIGYTIYCVRWYLWSDLWSYLFVLSSICPSGEIYDQIGYLMGIGGIPRFYWYLWSDLWSDLWSSQW